MTNRQWAEKYIYQTPTDGVHTYSPCANDCGNRARGGLVCADCLATAMPTRILSLCKRHRLFRKLIEQAPARCYRGMKRVNSEIFKD